MARINKKVILDYFGSFFKQYSPIPKELINRIRALVDEAECGCCNVTTVYWNNDASPSVWQLRFRDADDNLLVETSLEGSGPQRLCIPREATQLCLNIITSVATDFSVSGTQGFSFIDTDDVGEFCTPITIIDDSYILSPVLP